MKLSIRLTEMHQKLWSAHATSQYMFGEMICVYHGKNPAAD